MKTRLRLASLLVALLLGPAMADGVFAATKSPHGIFDLLSDQVSESRACWSNPAIDGVRWRGGWNPIQKTVDGPYDWAGPDAALALAQKHGKQIGMSFVASGR